jgi:lysophospholipase L1-like esterase
VKAIVDTIRNKVPEATLIVTGLFPRNDNMAFLPMIQEINEALQKTADGRKVRYLSVNEQLADTQGRLRDGMMNPDKLHPTVKAYQIWADALKPILRELLGAPAAEDHAPPPTGDPAARL